MTYNKSDVREWLHELSDAESSGNTESIPDSFYHYLWASEFCDARKVIELNCGSGFGISVLSKVASSCTGIDENRQAIKYAQRNFFVEGKTRFAVRNKDSADFTEFDVVLSFNSPTPSKSSIIEAVKSIFNINFQRGSDKFFIHGIIEDSSRELEEIREALNALSKTLPIKHSFFYQSQENLQDIRPYEGSENASIRRLIILVEGRNENALPSNTLSAPQKSPDLVSIVIPTYNRADIITETIDSALCQSYSKIEVIVIDDGSVDNTKEVVSRYGDKVRYYYKENGGIGSALNHGIRMMNGRWFKWLSSDDVLTPDAVEILVNYANETGAMIIYTDYDIIDKEGNQVKKFEEPHFSSYYEYASALWTRHIGNGSSSLIEKSCFDEVGIFDESLRSAEDYDWWLRACLLYGYRFFHIPKVTLRYRTHGAQLTEAVRHDAYVTAESIRKKIKQRATELNPEWWETLVRYQKIYFKSNQRGNAARRLLRRSLLHMPEGVRKSALKTWHGSLKPRVDADE